MSAFSGLFDQRIAFAEIPIGDQSVTIFEEEAAAVSNAVLRRKQEYAAGRTCAHRALAALGGSPAPLLAGPDRVPIWPTGYVGSITHDDRSAAAAAGRVTDGIRSIGIDLEPAEPLPADLHEMICRSEELAWLRRFPANECGLLARVIFGAKESAFKCQYPLTRRMLEFHEVAVSLDVERGTFSASYLCDEIGAICGPVVRGRFGITRASVACAIVLDVAPLA
ncbi:4'-phosphopantetheinyl transferase superfamily protein [Hyphomicrobium sp.]|uniref:4'-phosphopantetheinyl transferase family protein n=1 Tax=Hyphomicrobium sp. TaxID=82 RepID=UPI002CF635B5|nr:4'-phosphopantetheinyl transferase superfamily protein [Hyphomicrobium sp.]HRN87144.1 4'-phosphopantetheinyl transferase superfamily protein [Hyphomicrobium sp.]HRQ25523.1 4'-phosphopantetheinyl transferase superfamily protein [Hyphomicrobium sp.]